MKDRYKYSLWELHKKTQCVRHTHIKWNEMVLLQTWKVVWFILSAKRRASDLREKKGVFTCGIRYWRIREKITRIVLYHIVYHNCAEWCEGGSVYYCGCCMAMFSRSILHVFCLESASLKVRTATSTQQFSRALKTHLFTLDWSRGSPRRLCLVISADKLWRRIQIEWLINWLTWREVERSLCENDEKHNLLYA